MMSEPMKISDNPQAAWMMAGHAILALSAWDWAGLLMEKRPIAGRVDDLTDRMRAIELRHNAEKNAKLAKAITEFLAKARATHPEIFEDQPEAQP